MGQLLREQVSQRASDTMVVAGLAHMPQGLLKGERSEALVIGIEFETESGLIFGVVGTDVPPLGQKMLEECMVGRNFTEGPSEPIRELTRWYISPIRLTLCTCIAGAYKAFERYQLSETPKQKSK